MNSIFYPGIKNLNRSVYVTLVLTVLLSGFKSGSAYSQNNRILFSHLDVNDGLSDNSVKCIYRDQKGFIWFGTNSGLNRYDGYEFEVFRSRPSDSTSITDNSINVITEAPNGDLWIGTRSGLSVLDNEYYRFRRIYFEPGHPFNCQDINYITALSSDKEGNILAGTHNGLLFIPQGGDKISHILFDEKSCSSELNNITSIECDSDGFFWVGTLNGFIIKTKPGSGFMEKLESVGGSDGGGIRRMFIDRENNLWISNRNGLHLYDIRSGIWNAGFLNMSGRYSDNMLVTGIDQDPDGRIWVTTNGNGVFIFDDAVSAPVNITSMPYAEGSLKSNGLSALYCDYSGITWIGNAKKGVDYFKKDVIKFRLFRNYPTDLNSLSNNDVNSVTEDSNGNIWIGTNGGGLNMYDKKNDKFIHFRNDGLPGKRLSTDIIVSLFEDSDQKIWIGTFLGGLNCLDPKTGTIDIYRHNPDDSTSLSDDKVWSICEDSRGNLWIATLTGGLNLLDRETGKFTRYNSGNSSICFDYINHIFVDKEDKLWLSSANGLIYFDPVQNRSECFYSNPEIPSSLSDNHIISTYRDSRNFFWVCTNNGLNLMDSSNKSFRVFTEENGLPSGSVLRILEDEESNLWISTRNGISRLTVEKGTDDRYNFRFVNYSISDGLQGKEFNETAACASSDGMFWFGGIDGLNAFNPSEIKENIAPAKLMITGLRIDNKEVPYGRSVNNRVILEKPVFNTDCIILKYRENSFAVDFAALNFFFPERTMYSYNLEGFNEKWIVTEGKHNHAVFSNLKNGRYTFHLNGTNNDGIWNSNPVSIDIHILPPYWKTWYAYLVYILFILSALSLLRYLILARERMRIKLEQEQVESMHLHEMDALKIRFFTNISHELRTPLSLILSPAEKLKILWNDKPEIRYINLIMQNARRLLFMVNQLLDFRKMEIQGFTFNPSLGNITGFIRDTVLSFEDLAEQKNIKLSYHSSAGDFVTFFDAIKLEKILFNLLSNSFKFTQSGGKVDVAVNLRESEDNRISENEMDNPPLLVIKVRDTGIGIPADKIDKLFTSFYQIDSAVSTDHGSGIGLSLVREFVNLHNGEINVESEPGKGSCFTVLIPVKRNCIQSGSVYACPEPPSLVAGPTEDLPGEKPNILIAEDDDDFRFYLKDNLKMKYNIIEASNGEQALSFLAKVLPDLVISDIVMPGIQGLDLCRRIKSESHTSHIPVILLTGRSNEDVQFESFETGADDYITKPFSFQLLEARIENLIKLRKGLKKFLRSNMRIEPKDISVISLDEQFIQKALDLVEKNMSKTDYTVEELSQDMGLSRTLLYKKILSLTGKPPHEFIRSMRLKRAAQLLQKSQLNISEVAFMVGFNDPKYFRKHFKNEFGVLPSRYTESFNKNNESDN